MTRSKVPTLLVLDAASGEVRVDGVKVPGVIGEDIDIETHGGLLGAVTLTLFADNVLVISQDGSRRSPTARDAARRMIRRGLADVLAQLDEETEP